MKLFSVFFSLTLTLLFSFANAQPNYKYSTAEHPWPENFGNHRAIINIEKSSEVVSLDFKWRRHDVDVADRLLLLINAETGDTVKNIQRLNVNNEICDIRFGPVLKKGRYYLYYLPYEVQTGDGFYNKGYYPKENEPDQNWIKSIEHLKQIPNAKIVEVQSRTDFDSFYPMEIAATSQEETNYCKKFNNNMLLFPEDRKFPIRMQDKLPVKWLNVKQGASFIGNAQPNEYYVFQIGVWAPNETLEVIKYTFSDLKGKGKSIPRQNITCFNTEGIDPYGKPFNKKIDVEKGEIQPLWFGIDIPADQQKGEYRGAVEVSDLHGNKQTISIIINVSGVSLADRGDSEPWRHSRLRWLNSTLGIDDKPIAPYIPISFVENKISFLGRNMLIDPTTG
ncbi:MAG: glycoside hydrolase domain-containing protein, partial [Dysgonamonadaceae bacterium]